jgi:hypothetical protein
MAYLYCTATNTGKGFFTCLDRNRFHLEGRVGDVWIVEETDHAANWITRVSGVSKTKEEAQALVDAHISALQAYWDAWSEEERGIKVRPLTEILP